MSEVQSPYKVEPTFRFDPESHRYFLGDRQLPSVTKILKTCGIIDITHFNESARKRGEIVHKACHYLAEGDLDWTTLAEPFHGYVRAYEKAVKELRWGAVYCEVPFYSNLGYGCTPDQVGIFGKQDGVLEIKTGTMQAWTALQTAFQVLAVWPNDYLTKKRVGLELHEDGTWDVDEFTEHDNFDVCFALLTVYKWLSQNGGGNKHE